MIATNLLLIAQNFSDIYDAIEYKLHTVTKEISAIPTQIVSINGAGGYTPHTIPLPGDSISSKLTYLYNLMSEIRTCIVESGVPVTGMSNYAAAIRRIGNSHKLSISGLSTVSGESAEYLALFDDIPITATWTIISGNSYASISNGVVTILSGANNSQITLQAVYENITATKDVFVTYESGTISTSDIESETVTNPDGSVTETTTTTITTTDDQGNTTTSTVVTETTTNQDGSSSETESETVNNLDGSSTSTSNTTNYDNNGDVTGSSSNTTNVASDGSSNSSTTNYDENGDPTDAENVLTDVEGNVDTQDIVYNENGDSTVTSYTIDTTNNPNGAKDITGDGVNTEFIPFDGSNEGFELHIRFRSTPSEQPNPPLVTDTEDSGSNYLFNIFSAQSPFRPWPGFMLRWALPKTNYTSSNGRFILQYITSDNKATNVVITNANSSKAETGLFDFDIYYDPNLLKYSKKFTIIDNIESTTLKSLNVDFGNNNLDFTIGYALSQAGTPYRYSNVEIYEFSINKL